MTVLATPNNMKKYRRETQIIKTERGDILHLEPQRPIAYSRNTQEQYSADAGDYWNLDPDKPLLDSEGNPMILVFKVVSFKDADDFLPNV